MSLIDDGTPAWMESTILSRIGDVSPRGETLSQMFDRCLDFDSKSEFALAVRHCVSSGMISHVGQRYYKPGQAVAAPVQVPAAKPARKVYQRRQHFGNLLPDTEIGRVALVLCVFERHLLPEEVAEHAKVVAANRHLSSLCGCNYAYQRGVKIRTFCWSQSVDYPFAKVSDSDFANMSLPNMKVGALRKKLCPDT